MDEIKDIEIKIPTLAIVGRPNVGKSSLFNAIIGKRLAIVHSVSGVTRDRIMAVAVRGGKAFQIVDTGGLGHWEGEKKNLDLWEKEIERQVEAALDDADVIVMLTDVTEGLTPLDREIAVRLRGHGKQVLLAVNKVDNEKLEAHAADFSALGFDKLLTISSLHRRGIEELLLAALAGVELPDAQAEAEPFRIAVVGRPNVGKSSIVNSLLGEERVMVSPVSGTTRDAVDVEFTLRYGDDELPAVFIDTAGLRRRAKVDDAIEHYSVKRAESAIERSRLVLLIIEGGITGLTSQDRRIAGLIAKARKGAIIVANKWDLCKGIDKMEALEEIRATLPQMSYAPVVFTSALEGTNFNRLFDYVGEIIEQMEVKVPTSMLNRILRDAMDYRPPPASGNRQLNIFYGAMVGNEPPRFVVFVNNPELCPAHYLNYLNNCLRRAFGFIGLPIDILLRARPKKQLEREKSSGSKPKPGKSRPKPKTRAASRKPSGKSKVKPGARKKQQRKRR